MASRAGFALLALMAVAVLAVAADEAADAIAKGDAFLTKGEFTSALDQYHLACSKAPDNYLGFFKRATVYLAMGRSLQATKDLSDVLALKPDFVQARKRRAELYLRLGQLDESQADYTELGATEHATDLAKIEMVRQHMQAGRDAEAAGEFAAAVQHFTEAAKEANSDGALRMHRANCLMQLGESGEAIGDLMRATKLISGNTRAYFLLSKLYYRMGERADALTNIRECVKLDEEDKECFGFYKMLKKFNKAMDKLDAAYEHKRYAEVLQHLQKARGIDTSEPEYTRRFLNLECECFDNLQKPDTIAKCNEAIAADPQHAMNLVHKAHAFERNSDFEGSVDLHQKAKELDGENRQIQEGLERAQRLLKNSKKRDYYKILGVPRNANKRAVTKAYRQLAQEWHPDKFETEEEKAIAEKRFMDIAAAKEVLTDPEKRRMFDNGEDPLDAEEERERASRGHNPFGGGFNPFGGGQRFNFKFQ
ncbi:uncharacterized protein MONBRDRAFT_18046 [Monosiga brevicollis MX1]|uniref:J domain-containing protein n=1 Tax=Monosiga brevicollis TaxID=81824 RepID=A9UTS2_MONBE|nr:uncharacterized protein MONBRDRAFT_18046 [Monosiga brevicollis MX1]EDQ91297.1 predicted protein [Monosiga brevicollis MX1]|eukprot:XP_001743719.1 hypothetical protein [Monosiga brevicollis MX1]